MCNPTHAAQQIGPSLFDHVVAGRTLESRFGGSSDLDLLADLDDHQIFTEFQWTGVNLPRWWNQILLGRVWQHDV